MADYYTMETVRDQILLKGKVDLKSVFGAVAGYIYGHIDRFPENWKYCPCTGIIISRCAGKKRCLIRVGIFFDDPHQRLSVIEVIYIGDTQRGFIRVNESQLM